MKFVYKERDGDMEPFEHAPSTNICEPHDRAQVEKPMLAPNEACWGMDHDEEESMGTVLENKHGLVAWRVQSENELLNEVDEQFLRDVRGTHNERPCATDVGDRPFPLCPAPLAGPLSSRVADIIARHPDFDDWSYGMLIRQVHHGDCQRGSIGERAGRETTTMTPSPLPVPSRRPTGRPPRRGS
jgi:hypothetical protein